MAQTTEIFPAARKLYKKLFRSEKMNQLAHAGLNLFVNGWSRARGFYFPPKFTWEWRWEMLSQRYERDTVNLFKKIIKPGMVVVDIGAHVGYYTAIFAKLTGPTGTVFAFEADNDNFKILETNTKRYKNVKIFNTAVTDKTGSVDFYKIKGNTGCHSVVVSDNADKISVPATTLDEFISQNRLRRLDAIKIDIEGGEYLAFCGMRDLFTNAKNLSVVMEFNPTAIKLAGFEPQDFLNKIKEFNLEVLQILPAGRVEPIQIDQTEKFNYYRTGFVNLLLKK